MNLGVGRPPTVDLRPAAGPPTHRLGRLLLLLGLAAAGFAWPTHDELSQRLALALERKTLLDSRARPRPVAATAADPALRKRIERANAAIEQLRMPWPQLFEALEQVDGRELSLVSMTPDAKDGTVRLNGEAHSVAGVLKYVERLAARPGWTRVRLLAYTTERRGEARIVSFSVGATWLKR